MDSLYCTPETNVLCQLYLNKKVGSQSAPRAGCGDGVSSRRLRPCTLLAPDTFAGYLGKSNKAAPSLLPDDQGTGHGWTPARGWPSGAAPEEETSGQSLGRYRHLVAAWVHHGRKGSLGSISTHHILHPVLGPRVGQEPHEGSRAGARQHC